MSKSRGDSPPQTNRPNSNDILTILQCDYQAEEGKNTVRACLRSKSVPCREVALLLESEHGNIRQSTSSSSTTSASASCSAQSLIEAHRIVMEDYIPMLLREENRPEHPTPSLWYLSRIATIIRFLQLLLERRNRMTSEGTQPPRNETPKAAQSVLTPPQIDKMVATVVSKLSHTVLQCLQDWQLRTANRSHDHGNHKYDPNNAHEDDFVDGKEQPPSIDPLTSDATQTYNAEQIVAFTYASLLRLHQHYAKTRVDLMITLWKGLGTMVIVMSKTMPESLVDQSIQTLLPHFQDGMEQILSLCHSFVTTNGLASPIPRGQQVNQCRLLEFFCIRIIQLIRCWTGAERDDKIARIVESVLRLLGMVQAVQILLWKHRPANTQHAAFLQPYMDFASTVERLFLPWIIPTSQTELVLRSALNYLLPANGSEKNGEGSDSETSKLATILGRVRLFHRILGDDRIQKLTKTFSLSDVESLLRIIETLITFDIPQCHAPLMMASTAGPTEEMRLFTTTFIANNIRIMAQCLFCIEVGTPCMDATKRAQLHRLVIRWLAPATSSPETRNLHALTREVAISLVYLHMVGLSACPSQTAAANAFASLLAKLVWDPRTTSVLRKTIASLILRLLHSPTTTERITNSLLDELVRLLKEKRKSKKRKKKSNERQQTNWKLYSLQDLQTIGFVISHIQLIEQSPKVVDKLRSFCRQVVEGNLKSIRLGVGSMEQAAFLLATLQGVIQRREGDKPKDGMLRFHQLTGVDLSRLVGIIVSSLPAKIWKSFGGDRTIKEHWTRRKAVLISSALRLCSLLSSEGYDFHVPEICRLISFCGGFSFLPSRPSQLVPTERDCYAATVVFESISLLLYLGKVIPSNCSKNILQVGRKLSAGQMSAPPIHINPSFRRLLQTITFRIFSAS